MPTPRNGDTATVVLGVLEAIHDFYEACGVHVYEIVRLIAGNLTPPDRVRLVGILRTVCSYRLASGLLVRLDDKTRKKPRAFERGVASRLLEFSDPLPTPLRLPDELVVDADACLPHLHGASRVVANLVHVAEDSAVLRVATDVDRSDISVPAPDLGPGHSVVVSCANRCTECHVAARIALCAGIGFTVIDPNGSSVAHAMERHPCHRRVYTAHMREYMKQAVSAGVVHSLMVQKRSMDWGHIEFSARVPGRAFVTSDYMAAIYAVYRSVPCIYFQQQDQAFRYVRASRVFVRACARAAQTPTGA